MSTRKMAVGFLVLLALCVVPLVRAGDGGREIVKKSMEWICIDPVNEKELSVSFFDWHIGNFKGLVLSDGGDAVFAIEPGSDTFMTVRDINGDEQRLRCMMINCLGIEDDSN